MTAQIKGHGGGGGGNLALLFCQTIILSNCTLNAVLLLMSWRYSQFGQVSFFGQGVVASAETHNWSKHQIINNSECSAVGGPSLSREGRDQERDQERAGRQGGELWRAHIWTGHGCWLRQLLAALVTCRRPGQGQGNQNSHKDDGWDHEARPYQRSYRQVIAAEGRRITPLGMWLALCCSRLPSQSHSHLYVSSTRWAQRVVSNKNKESRER